MEAAAVTQRRAAAHVVLLTSSADKVREYGAVLAKHGVAVRQGPGVPDGADVAPDAAKALAEAPGCVAVLHDHAALLEGSGRGGAALASLRRTGLATAVVTLTAHTKTRVHVYVDEARGFVDPALRVCGARVFGWDDVFVPLATGASFHAATKAGAKVSSRDAVASRFARDVLHFKAHVDLKHAPLSPIATVDFGLDAAAFVEGHPLLSRGLAVPGFGSVLAAVLDGGVFLRSPGNRRERNYWWPGLNAGLPLTPKADAVHEATYMAHDFGHFLVPDLLFTGSAACCSAAGQRLYLVHRMLSEAVTMVLADMLYADGLRRQGVPYDWGARRIWPLLRAAELHTGQTLLGAAGVDVRFLRALLAANVAFALRGDAAPWRALVGAAGEAAFAAFEAKYAPFFVADFAWTAANVAHMVAKAASFRAWWAAAEPLRSLCHAVQATTPTVDEWLGTVGDAAACGEEPRDLVAAAFDALWHRVLEPTLRLAPAPGGASSLPRAARLFRAFLRYSMGQHAAFVEHARSKLAAPVAAALASALARANGALTVDEVAGLRDVYAAFIDGLAHTELAISPDDAAVFVQTYPLFQPVFVAYSPPGTATAADVAAAFAAAIRGTAA
jgi:hypothetical protein